MKKAIAMKCTQEVEAALICEAKKRGYNIGTAFKSMDYDLEQILTIESDEFCYYDNSIQLRTNSNRYPWRDIFSKGTWATIIETITKEEAEKILNKKIV